MKCNNLYSIILCLVFACSAVKAQTLWIDVTKSEQISVNGLPWYQENGRKFIRLPLKNREKITPTAWWMSMCPSGARVRFKTDSSKLKLRIKHGMKNQDRLAMWHMSSLAVSGIDLYTGPPEKMNFWKTTTPKDACQEYEHVYFEGHEKKLREFTLYLPVYAELESLAIGVEEGAKIELPTPYKYSKPFVVYGTSITQGACAGRGANGFVPLVSRALNCDFVNLGFSGSGCGEPEMAELMLQVDASIYIVDSVANMDTTVMQQRYEKFIKILRKNKPDVPVVLMTKVHFSMEIENAEAEEYDLQHKPLFETYNKLKAEGDTNIYLFDTGSIIKTGRNHPSVDGIHLTDLGFQKIADQLVPFLKDILTKQSLSKKDI